MKADTIIEVRRGKPRRDGRPPLFYFHAVARNGKVITDSQGYTRRWSAIRGALRAHPDAVVHDRT
jgi:hypothetical protein